MTKDKQIILKQDEYIDWLEREIRYIPTQVRIDYIPQKIMEAISKCESELASLKSQDKTDKCPICGGKLSDRVCIPCTHILCKPFNPKEPEAEGAEEIKADINNIIEGWLARNRLSPNNSPELKASILKLINDFARQSKRNVLIEFGIWLDNNTNHNIFEGDIEDFLSSRQPH